MNEELEDDGVEEMESSSESYVYVDDGLAVLKDSIRLQIRSDVEAFLANGGAIREIAPNIVADPPKKPQSNYGGQPI